MLGSVLRSGNMSVNRVEITSALVEEGTGRETVLLLRRYVPVFLNLT